MTASAHRPAWSLFGVPVDLVTLDEAEAAVWRAAETRARLSFVTPNLNWLVRALRDDAARAQILRADLSLADGAPVVALARRLGAPIPGRAAGSDLFERLRRPRADARRLKVFFFGGREGAAKKAAGAVEREGGGVAAAGWLDPGHGDVASMSTPAIREAINAAQPDFVLVALGAAKGQAWIEANQDALAAPVIAHLGAVIDFVAGTIPRAPVALRKTGLEWAWRIAAEPALWRRYWTDGRALPGLWWRAGRLRRAMAALETGRPLQLAREGGTLRLSGDATLPHLRPLCDAIAEADGPLILDLSQLGGLDGAAIALFQRAGAQIVLASAGAAQARLLAAHHLPLRPDVSRPAPAPRPTVSTTRSASAP